MRPDHETARLPLALLLAALVAACAAPSKSTRLKVEDFEDVAVEMAASLRKSAFLADRGPTSPPIVIAVSKVENLSSDILSDGEKWYLMDRVIDSHAIDALRDADNIRFVIPAEKLRLLNKKLEAQDQAAVARNPTHTMTARLLSLTRTASQDRTELYDCQFTLTELATGEVVWTDNIAIKRIARGKAYN